MKAPKMILFDYGGTLLCEPGFDIVRGQRALFSFVQSNPGHLSPEQVCDTANDLFEQLAPARSLGIEVHEHQFQRLLYERLGIKLSVSYAQAEEILWTAASPGALMPDAGKLIDAVNRLGIRSGVISNISWSGDALKRRLNRLLPDNQFEFVIASSEYCFRKPSPYLFEIALKKAGLPPDDVWFCGNSLKADVEGAARAGLYPVWYDNNTEQEYKGHIIKTPPVCDHLHIRKWAELIVLLDQLTGTV